MELEREQAAKLQENRLIMLKFRDIENAIDRE